MGLSRAAGERRWGDGWTEPLVAPKGVRVKGNHLLAEFDELAEPLGLPGWYGWQRHWTAVSTRLDKDGNYSVMELYLEAMRRQGKTEWLRGRCLLGLTRGERIMITSQDLEQTVTEIYEPVLDALENMGLVRGTKKRGSGDFYEDRKLGHYVCNITKKEWHKKRKPPRLRVATDKPKGARGKENDTNIVDESAHIMQGYMGIAGATGATIQGYQQIQASTAGTDKSDRWMTETRNAQEDQEHGDTDVAIMIWAGSQEDNWRSEKLWHKRIPTLGKPGGVSLRFLRRKYRSEEPEVFKREYLGITPFRRMKVFKPGEWEALERIDAVPSKGLCALGVDVSPDGGMVAIAGVWQVDGLYKGALLRTGDDDTMLTQELLGLCSKYRPWIIAGDVRTPANHALLEIGSNRRIHRCTAIDASAAATGLRATVVAGELAVTDNPLLDAAATSAETRPIAEIGWGFDRRAPDEDNPSPHIAPLVALSLAMHALKQRPSWGKKGAKV